MTFGRAFGITHGYAAARPMTSGMVGQGALQRMAMLSVLLALSAAAPAVAPAKPAVDVDATQGLSGLPVPRFVSLKSDKAYLRTGPGDRYPVQWVYVRKGLPVEVVREYGIWRQVRDIGGSIGWMNKQLIGGTRTAVVTGSIRTMYATPDLQGKAVWRIAPGAIVRVVLCSEAWCRVDRGGKSGYILRAQLWGVSPTETIG
jgi:SH3-like domain-containing protein